MEPMERRLGPGRDQDGSHGRVGTASEVGACRRRAEA